jgi:alkaline phosphatase
MHEMDGLAKTLEYLKQYVDEKGDTLVVATADHNTGGLSIGTDGEYQWHPELVKDVKHSVYHVAKQVMDGEHVLKVWMNSVDLPITPQQLTGIAEIRQKARAYVKSKKAELKQPVDQATVDGLEEDAREMIEAYIAQIISKATKTGWTSTGHTGGDVQVFAHGPGKSRFIGHQDNTDIGKKLIEFVKK